MDSEMGLPILLATILPIANGLFFGYTFHCWQLPDGCLWKYRYRYSSQVFKRINHKKELQLSQIVTLLIGVLPYYWRPKCKCIGAHAHPMHSWYRDYLFLSWCFYFEESAIHRCFLWVCFWGTTILLIITENKLPLGIKFRALGWIYTG
jgi:SSS family solute:Na+ symporter